MHENVLDALMSTKLNSCPCNEADRGRPWSRSRCSSNRSRWCSRKSRSKRRLSPSPRLIVDPLMNQNDVMCANPECLHVYCFEHSDAHPGRSCEDYRVQTAAESAVSECLIATTSKPCPGCGFLSVSWKVQDVTT